MNNSKSFLTVIIVILLISGIILAFGGSQKSGNFQNKNNKIAIDSYNPRAVSIRNVGSSPIDVSDIQVSVGGEQRTCDWVSDVDTIPPYTVRRCSFSGAECTSGQTIKVSINENSAEVAC